MSPLVSTPSTIHHLQAARAHLLASHNAIRDGQRAWDRATGFTAVQLGWLLTDLLAPVEILDGLIEALSARGGRDG